MPVCSVAAAETTVGVRPWRIFRGRIPAFLIVLVIAQNAAAEYGRIPPTAIDPAALAVDEASHLGRLLDKRIALRGEDGAEFALGDMLNKPLILVFSYFQCDGACPTLNRNLAKTILSARRFHPGEDYRVLTVSFDRNDGLEQLQHFVHHLKLPDAARTGWRHAVVKRGEELAGLTQNVGYKYFWSIRDKVFLHPNVLIFITPEGRVARYLYGLSASSRDVELALIDAYGDKISKPSQAIDFLTGICFSYNFSEGRYVLNYPLFIAMGSLGLGVVLVMFSFSVFKKRKPRRLLNA